MAYDRRTTEKIIAQTKKWIVDVVIGCNFCPFAAREVKAGSIHYQVDDATDISTGLQAFLRECTRLDTETTIGTTLLIFPDGFQRFDDYLDLVSLAEKLLHKSGYEGIYQVASFHPLYRFANTTTEDPGNYTNRSIYPMLHVLREEQVEKALARYPHPEQIPDINIDFTRKKGEAYMRMLREACISITP